MGEHRCSFKCAECGSEKLRLTGFEMLDVAVGFDVGFGGPEAGSDDWNVEYTLPKDGPRAFIFCEKCRREVTVCCRNEHTRRKAVLWPAEIYQLLYGVLAIHGTYDDAFKGKAELDWKKFMGKLIATHPQLGTTRRRRRPYAQKSR
jgi:hypothetical protein